MQALNAVNKRGITTRSIMTVRICKHPGFAGCRFFKQNWWLQSENAVVVRHISAA